jgi:hypothetical protein
VLPGPEYGKILLSVLAMILGILAGSCHQILKNRKRIVSFRKEFGRIIRSAYLFRSLVVAPIVFAAVYLAARTQPDYVLMFIFAFQNGFFCDTLINMPLGQDSAPDPR